MASSLRMQLSARDQVKGTVHNEGRADRVLPLPK